MKPIEIDNFLAANSDLFGPGLGEQPVVDIDDLHKLLSRLFKSKEYAAFIERERWQRAKDIFIGKADADTIKGLALMPRELEMPEIKF